MKSSNNAGSVPAVSGSSGNSKSAGAGSAFFGPNFSLAGAWAIAFGCAVGWGSFVMPGIAFLPKAGPLGTVLGVIIGGAIMAVIAWNYHCMMCRNPGPGGAFAYATQAFGIDHGYLCAWFLVITYAAIIWANATALAIISRYVFGDVLRFGFRYTVAGFEVCGGDVLLAAVAIAVATAICCRPRLSSRVQAFLGIAFFVGIAVIFGVAVAKHNGGLRAIAPAFSPSDTSHAGQVLAIVALSPWIFVGFEAISHVSGEFAFPVGKSFRVMVVALVAAVVAYSLLAVLPVLAPVEGFASWDEYIGKLGEQEGALSLPTFATAGRVMGVAGVAAIAVTMLGAVFTNLVGNTLVTARLIAAMSRERLLPEWFGRVSGRGAPRNATLAVAAVSALVPLLGRTAIGFIVDVTTVGAAIAYAYTSAATWKLARADGRRFDAAVGLCGLALAVGVAVVFIVPNFAADSAMAMESYLILVVWSIAGLLWFHHIFRLDNEMRFGRSTVVWISTLAMILFMSVMWMRTATRTIEKREFEQVSSIWRHGADAPSPEKWLGAIKRSSDRANYALAKVHVMQIGLTSLSILVLFSLYNILRRRERQLEEEKSRARSYFFSTVSHDIRTPLNAIIGYSEMLKEGFKTEEERREALDSISKSGKTLIGIVDDILDLSKLESGLVDEKTEPTDVPRALSVVVDSFRATNAKPDVELRCEIAPMPTLLIDPHRLRQVAFNLVGNAIKFTDRGSVVLRAWYEAAEGSLFGTLRFSIADTGVGIAPEDLKNITSPYTQVNSKLSRHGGTGLGLAICKNLVTSRGGRLDVTSELGRGSTFTVTLPGVESTPAPSSTAVATPAAATAAPPAAAKAAAPQAPATAERATAQLSAQPEPPPPPPPPSIASLAVENAAPVENNTSVSISRRVSKPRRILLADDSALNLKVLRALLKKFGTFDVTFAADGEEACKALLEAGDNPYDLVLTDMWMPNLDGEGLVRKIRADKTIADTCTIVVTADVEMRGKFADMGFDGILLKPVSSKSLGEVFSEPTPEDGGK